ncbi:MAG: 16S rRNA (uracil(1498)-N(3))-methyltransferase [Nitrospirota bacterium]
MPRIFIPSTAIKEGRISITGEKARYLVSVLRCRKGDGLVVFDGRGNCFRTMIIKADRREVISEVIEEFPCNLESPINITLVQSLLKGEKMDSVIQKTTELGVKEIIPVVTLRSQLRETRKVDRWRKIAEESSRQSGRSVIPVVHEPIDFNYIFSTYTKQGRLNGFIFYEEEGMKISEAVEVLKVKGGERGLESNVFVIVGPEGGFTKEEITLAKERGLLVTSLGRRVLRAETAAISAVTLVQFLLGDLG